MNADKIILEKLKQNGISNEYVRSIERLVEKLNGPYQLEIKINPRLSEYQLRHKFANNNIVLDIDDRGRLWVRRDALDQFCTEEKVSALYKCLKELTGWKWDGPAATNNPAASVKAWHNKVDEIADAFIKVLPHKDDEDLDNGEET